jgi:hypothetical protein
MLITRIVFCCMEHGCRLHCSDRRGSAEGERLVASELEAIAFQP